MLENILKLDGTKALNSNEQKNISGGLGDRCIAIRENGCVPMSSALNCTSQGGIYITGCRCCEL